MVRHTRRKCGEHVGALWEIESAPAVVAGRDRRLALYNISEVRRAGSLEGEEREENRGREGRTGGVRSVLGVHRDSVWRGGQERPGCLKSFAAFIILGKTRT